MERSPFDDSTMRAFVDANSAIANQNARFKRDELISDPDFHALVAESIAEEQEASVALRAEAGNRINYDHVFNTWDRLLDKAATVHTQIADTQASIERVKQEATAAKQLAPLAKAKIDDLATRKMEQHEATLVVLRDEIALLQEQELGLIAVSAWTIPLAYQSQTSHMESTIDQPSHPDNTGAPEETIPMTDSPEDLSTRVVPPQPEIILCEQDLEAVLAAVLKYALEAGEKGISVQEMRKNVVEIAVLSDDEYVYFKERFPQIRQDIVDLAKANGTALNWTVSGRTKGTRYVLATGPSEISPAVQASATNASVDSMPLKDTPTSQPNSHETLAEKPMIQIIRNRNGSARLGGEYYVIEIPFDELGGNLGIKDPQLQKHVKSWIEWIQNNPRSSAVRKIEAIRGIRVDGIHGNIPLFRFSPKDAQGVSVPRQYMRRRMVFAYVNDVPAIANVLNHDEFDRAYH